MKRRIITTKDGSKTIHIDEWNEQYHSVHGAIQEARHVFIKHGLHHVMVQQDKQALSILEIGFGTGLNAFLTYLETQNANCNINYVGVEAYPVGLEELSQLNYVEQLSVQSQQEAFNAMHTTPWGESAAICERFTLTKVEAFFKDIAYNQAFDLVYFDAFGARVQPELWEVPIFKLMFNALKANGVLVTYSAKGSARRAMQEVGFFVEKLPGPPGKREMLRAERKAL